MENPKRKKIYFLPMHDVQMLPFSERSSVAHAIAWADRVLPDLDTEDIASVHSDGRVLARTITSRVNVPGFHRSMMDGFAVRAIEIEKATESDPVLLRVAGEIYPGDATPRSMAAGQAVRIMTGAPVPAGADAVIPVEHVHLRESAILIDHPVIAGKHVGLPGEDVACGQCVLEAGRRIRPQDIGLLSSIGINSVSVLRKPRVHLVTTGNELLPAGTTPVDCMIADANSPMLKSLVNRDGGEFTFSGIVPDNPASILEALKVDTDILIISGGSSVGCEDYVPHLLARYGELGIHGIRMRPGSPIGMGMFQNHPVFILPGNPVACLCGYDFFAGRAIRNLTGRGSALPYRRNRIPLGESLKSIEGRTDYVRVQVTADGVFKSSQQGASMLFSAVQSDGFLIIPESAAVVSPGETVTVYYY